MDSLSCQTTSEPVLAKHRGVAHRERELRHQVAVSPRGLSPRSRPASQAPGVAVGVLVGLDDAGMPLVDHPENSQGLLLPARSVVALGKDQVGREVALMFEKGDSCRPIIMGVLQTPATAPSGVGGAMPQVDKQPVVVESDGKRLVFAAENEIVLRCGEASITLTRAGKVLIRGTYVLSRSSGANCVKGASIQLN